MSCIKKLSEVVNGSESKSINRTIYEENFTNRNDSVKRQKAVDTTYADRVFEPSPTSWMSRAQIYQLTGYTPNPVSAVFELVKGIKFHFAVNEEDKFIVTASPADEFLKIKTADPVLGKINYRTDEADSITGEVVNELQDAFENSYLLAGNFPSIEFSNNQLLSMLGHDDGNNDIVRFEILLFPDPEGCDYFNIVEKLSAAANDATTVLTSPYACPKQCYQ